MRGIFKYWDIKLILVVLLLFSVGMGAIYSSTYNMSDKQVTLFFYKQIMWLGISVLGSFLLIKIGYRRILEWSYFLYFIIVMLLLLVLIFGVSQGGAHRWLRIGNFNFQPSEFAKLGMILVTVRFLASYKRNNFGFNKSVLLLLMLCIPVVLIAAQPDLGTSLIFIPVVGAIWFISGLGLKYLLTFSILAVAGSPFVWTILKEYQKQRLLTFINPDLDPLGAGYTVIQSKIAIGSGRITGKGWLSGTQNILNFLPERHTDFIFSVIGEEWGFLGSLIIVGLYIYLLKRGLDIAVNATHRCDKLLAIGIVVLFGVHIITNIGMSMGIMPAVGLPLPFISYGGSNLVVSIICIAFLLEIYKKARSS